MARWQIIREGEPLVGLFDDGRPEQPGDESFSQADADAHAASLGGVATYVGPSLDNPTHKTENLS